MSQILATGLRKRYGDTAALDGFDLDVSAGTVCGLLGPNGAGKTTAVRILSTLVRADDGRAEVAGYDVASQPDDVRRRIGLVGQHAAVDEIISGRQNLVMFGRLYHLGQRAAATRADELLDRFGLADTGDKPVKLYSGGMRRRLDLAASLILAPPVLFLDEPTTGLDPRGRNEVWDAVRGLVAGGTTVLLTTQYLDEADQLATSIAVMDAGRVIATGTPEALKAKLGGDRIDVVVRDAAAVTEAATVLGQVVGRPADVDADRRWISAQLAGGTDCAGCCGAGGTDCAGCCGAGGTRVRDRMAALTESLRALEDAGIAVEDLNLRRPTLDEVFLSLTGERTGSRALRTERAGLSGGAR